MEYILGFHDPLSAFAQYLSYLQDVTTLQPFPANPLCNAQDGGCHNGGDNTR